VIPGIARLFARTRAAGMSLVLATQELSDLHVGPGESILDQVLGNLGALIAHRQTVPQSAELVAAIAGSRGVWVRSERTLTGLTGAGAPTPSGTRTRGREPVIHPDDIKRLANGVAGVIVPAGGTQPQIVQILRAEAGGGEESPNEGGSL
jgi:type IV secretory pathway TraG/TraD family ATPase VirD4